MMDIDVYALFPGNWLTDKVLIGKQYIMYNLVIR